VALSFHSQASWANENGVSLWLPGLFGSLAAAPAVPGRSLGTVAYHTSVDASGNVAAARQISIGQVPATANVNLLTGIVGNLDTSIAGTLTAQVGPIVATRNGFLSDSLTGVGDLYPLVTLKWNQGVVCRHGRICLSADHR